MTQEAYTKRYGGQPEKYGRVAVLFGGVSSEREVSLRSGSAIASALEEDGFSVKRIDITENAIDQLTAEQIDRAFIALHGVGGEDGKIQAVLDWLKIPYTGSDMASSALAMNKLQTKYIWQSRGFPTPKYEVINQSSDWGKVFEQLGGEVFVKPIHEGSSLGMSFVDEVSEMAVAYKDPAKFDEEVLAESKVTGREFSVAVLNGQALPPVEMKTNNRFYDYQAKYFQDDTQYFCPCNLTDLKDAELRDLAVRSFNIVGCSGWGRVDFMQDEDENFYLLEVNTVPGMTNHSLVPMSANAVGLSFNELVCEILSSTLDE